MSRGSKKRPKETKPSLAAEWRAWYESKGPVLRFVSKFAVLIALFYGVLATTYLDRAFYAYLEANAWLSNFLLDAMGQNTHVSGIVIASPQFSVTIQRGCDAIEPTWLFCAAVLSFRAPLARKLLGILVGIVLLQTLNVARIVTLFWIGLHLPALFNTSHLEIWPTAFILAAILLFVGWIEWSGRLPKPHEIP